MDESPEKRSERKTLLAELISVRSALLKGCEIDGFYSTTDVRKTDIGDVIEDEGRKTLFIAYYPDRFPVET